MRPCLNKFIQFLSRTFCISHISMPSQSIVRHQFSVIHATLNQIHHCAYGSVIRKPCSEVSNEADGWKIKSCMIYYTRSHALLYSNILWMNKLIVIPRFSIFHGYSYYCRGSTLPSFTVYS